MTEADIQKQIRMAISPYGTYFRANVGQAWTGDEVYIKGGDVFIKNARTFITGLPKGFPDLFGFTLKDDLPIFTAIEVKSPKGRVRKEQAQILEFLKSRGVLCGIARSSEEALSIIKGK